MESNRLMVFRQENRKGLTAAAIVACLLFSPVLSAGFFMPQVLSAIPVLLLVLLGYAGPVSAVVCASMVVTLAGVLFSVWGSVCALMLLVPTVLVSVAMLERGQPFWQSVAAGGVTMFSSMGVVVALLGALAGSDVVSALTGIMEEAFSVSGGFGDMFLNMLIRSGIVASPEGADLNGLIASDPDTRRQILDSLVLMMDSVLRLELPMQMATGSVAAGLLGQAVLRKGMLSRGVRVEYPRLMTWRVPKGWGRILCGTLMVLYLLSNLVPRSMNTMFYVFSGVFDRVFALQGIAAVCYMLHQRGKSAGWQRAAFIAGYFILGSMAVLIGIFDQAVDIAHRREKLDAEENPFDPRREE